MLTDGIKYDNILLSNIASYYKLDEFKYLFDECVDALNETGKMLVSYLYDTDPYTGYKPGEDEIYNLPIVFKKFPKELEINSFKGNKEVNITKFSDITSGKPFYVSIQVNSGVNKITKLTGKVNISEKTANIWFLESKAGYKQNLIIVDPGEITEKLDIAFNYDIKLQGSLKVITVVNGNETIK